MRFRALAPTLVLLSGLFSINPGSVAPVHAQVFDPVGVSLPWFRSEAEKRDRQACEQNLPECKGSVRQEIAKERMASAITPWLLLGVAVLCVLVFLRVQERSRAKRRRRAQQRHDPQAFRELDKTTAERAELAERRERRAGRAPL